jgi:glycosyltransferase involved in cell wall biosynthesis
MKVAIITTDNRETYRAYHETEPDFGKAPKALLEGFARMGGEIEVHVLACVQQPVQSPARLADNIFLHTLVVPKIGWLRTLYQGCVRAVRRKVKEIRPDLVHGQGTERDCGISAVFSGAPNIITVHGKMTEIEALHNSPIGSFPWCAARVENFTLPRTDGIIVISDYVHARVRHYGVPLWPIPNAIQRMFFDFPRVAGKKTIPQLINVGVVSDRKRQRELLQILCALREEGLQFEMLFIGSLKTTYAPVFMRELDAANERFGGFSHVTRVGDEDFCRLFDTASAMVHFSSEESFGLTFAEALARNLHLFASDVGSIREIAAGVAGVEIFPLQDWAGLKDAIRAWLRRGNFDRPRPDQAPAPIIQRYHPELVARQHLDVYREVLARR